jgi:hypothetical protein
MTLICGRADLTKRCMKDALILSAEFFEGFQNRSF